MPRWLWWTPLGLFVLFFAVQFFRLGWLAATLTETDVITTYSKRYLRDSQSLPGGQAARLTDCVAYPGTKPGIWLVVSCGPKPFDPDRHHSYHVNRLGGAERIVSPQSRRDAQPDPGVPQT